MPQQHQAWQSNRDFFSKIFLDVFILDWRLPGVDEVNFLGNYVYSGNVVVLGEEGCDGEADVAGAGDGDIIF